MDARERAYLGYQEHERHESDGRLRDMERQLGIVDMHEARLAELMERHATHTVVVDDAGTTLREKDIPIEESDDVVTIVTETDGRSGGFRYAMFHGDGVVLSGDHIQGYATSFQEARAAGLTSFEKGALGAVQRSADGLEFFVQELSLVGAPQQKPARQFDLAA